MDNLNLIFLILFSKLKKREENEGPVKLGSKCFLKFCACTPVIASVQKGVGRTMPFTRVASQHSLLNHVRLTSSRARFHNPRLWILQGP